MRLARTNMAENSNVRQLPAAVKRGRPQGKRNRNKEYLMARLKDMYGEDFNPIMKMAGNAVEMQKLVDEENTIETRERAITAWDKIAKYTQPQLKAIEVTAGDEPERSDDELREELAALIRGNARAILGSDEGSESPESG